MPAARPLPPANLDTPRDERELSATLEHHGFETFAEASEFVMVREATTAELQSAWNTYQLDRGRGWN